MVSTDEWGIVLAAAKSGDDRAADQITRRLLDWTQRHQPARGDPDLDALRIDFVAHLIRDQFAHLAPVEPGRLEAYLWASLRHFLIDEARSGRSRQAWEFLLSDRPTTADEDGANPDMDRLAAAPPDPEALALQHAERDAIWAEVALLDPLNRLIFMLKFEEELSAVEIGRLLNKSAGAIRARVFLICRHLRELLREWEG